MRIAHILVYTMIALLHSIDVSLQFDCLPDGAPIRIVSRDATSSSSADVQPSSSRSIPPAKVFRVRSRSPAATSKAPQTTPSLTHVLGFGLAKLENIQFIPNKNPSRLFVLRRFTFPADEQLQLLEGQNTYRPIPEQEHVVLTTLSGDVFAILESRYYLAGIFAHSLHVHAAGRARINMRSGTITLLTKDEIKEVPVGSNRPIDKHYKVELIDKHLPARSSSPKRSIVISVMPSWFQITRYAPEKLKLFRLIPNRNPNRQFEVRRYTLPVDRPITLLERKNVYVPLPNQEQIVLSTFDGDVYAIFKNSDYLSGIYTHVCGTKHRGRAKINMESGTITVLTKDEIKEIPVGACYNIPANFKIERLRDTVKPVTKK